MPVAVDHRSAAGPDIQGYPAGILVGSRLMRTLDKNGDSVRADAAMFAGEFWPSTIARHSGAVPMPPMINF